MSGMCGRIIQSSGPLRLAIVDGLNVPDPRISGLKPRYNGAPSLELLVIRENHETGRRSLDLLRWGLVPHWCEDKAGGRKPINAKAETVAGLPSFRDAYARRRCIVPVDGFFEWHKAGRRPYAVAMRDGSPFAIGGLWENWKSPVAGQRDGEPDPRPHAAHSRARRLRSLAGAGGRCGRSAEILSVGRHDDVADLDPRELAQQRRSLDPRTGCAAASV